MNRSSDPSLHCTALLVVLLYELYNRKVNVGCAEVDIVVDVETRRMDVRQQQIRNGEGISKGTRRTIPQRQNHGHQRSIERVAVIVDAYSIDVDRPDAFVGVDAQGFEWEDVGSSWVV